MEYPGWTPEEIATWEENGAIRQEFSSLSDRDTAANLARKVGFRVETFYQNGKFILNYYDK